jgi:hypothetical protein
MKKTTLFLTSLAICLALILSPMAAAQTAAAGSLTPAGQPFDLPAPPHVEPGEEGASSAPANYAAAPEGINAVTSASLGAGNSFPHGLIYDNGYLYASTRTSPARVLKINPSTLAVDGSAILPAGQNEGEDIAAANGYLWVILYTNGARLVRVDPATMAAVTAINFPSGDLAFGTSVEFAFGYLWVGGINKLARVDITNPLAPTYTIFDYSALALDGYILFNLVANDANYMWANAHQYSFTIGGYSSDTFIRINPASPGVGYISTTVLPFFPDDMVHQGGKLYAAVEGLNPTITPSSIYRFPTALTPYTSTFAFSKGSYGLFANPLDKTTIWGAFVNSPGKLIKFDLNGSPLITVTLPGGYNDPSEVAFDPAGAMYVTTWQNPAGVVRYTAPVSVSVGITISGATTRLNWLHNQSEVTGYEVWRSAAPYFLPGDIGSIRLATITPGGLGTNTVYDDTSGGVGSVANNYFYVVRAVNLHGLVSPLSNRVGDFDYALTPGVTGTDNYTVIGMPLTTGVLNAAEVSAYIGASVQQVLHWDAASQTFEFWLPAFGFGTNFAVLPGEAYWLALDPAAPAVVSFVGGVPAQDAISFSMIGNGTICQQNEFILPLDQPGILFATDLTADMSAGNPEQMLQWDESSQTYEFWLPDFGFGTDFPTRPGYPYHACLRANLNWP